MEVMKLDINKKYKAALEEFVEIVKEDNNIISVFVYGSIVDGELWEKSDIDIWLISKENNKKIYNQYSLVVEDIHLRKLLHLTNHIQEDI